MRAAYTFTYDESHVQKYSILHVSVDRIYVKQLNNNIYYLRVSAIKFIAFNLLSHFALENTLYNKVVNFFSFFKMIQKKFQPIKFELTRIFPEDLADLASLIYTNNKWNGISWVKIFI